MIGIPPLTMLDISGRKIAMNDTTTYVWIITTDHLFDPNWEGVHNEAGTIGGPGATHVRNTDVLRENFDCYNKFRMFDDDGELYYTGTLFWNGDCEPSEEVLASPLDDFGMPNAGCTRISYWGKPGWEIG